MQFKQTGKATRFFEYHLYVNGDVGIINSTVVLHRLHRTSAEPRSRMYSLFGTTIIIKNKLIKYSFFSDTPQNIPDHGTNMLNHN